MRSISLGFCKIIKAIDVKLENPKRLLNYEEQVLNKVLRNVCV